MGAPTELFLTKLAPGVETPAGKVRGLAAAAPALAADGLVTIRKEGRTLLVTLTGAGADRAAALAAAAPAKAKAPRAKAPAAPARIAALEAMVADLARRVAALEGGAGAAVPGHGDGPPATNGEALRAAVLAAVGELDARHRYGGIVPIPDVRAELRRGGIADDEAVTAALEQLERAWKIDLSVAQSPTQVTDRAAGIERPGRGLLYYVARR